MGCHANITRDKHPIQGNQMGKRVMVCFHYDTEKQIVGTVVRDDIESPFETIIKLDDGRYIRASECQWSPAP